MKTKLTKMINLKTAIVGAGITTALSGFIVSPVQAISIRGLGYPDNFIYDFTINTEKSSNTAVETLTIQDDITSVSATNENPLSIEVESFTGDRTLLDGLFDGFFGDQILDDNIFLYTINLDETLSSFTSFNSIGFVVPTNFITNLSTVGNPINFDTSAFSDPLSGLEEMERVLGSSGGNVEFPIVTDGSLLEEPAEGYSFSFDNTKVPESDTTTAVLTLGILGLSILFKSKNQDSFRK